MGTLGQFLRSAREARNIDIRDAAQQTRISVNYLRALEEEDFAKLPGPVFVKGFLKNYARFLKLDETEALRRFAEVTSTPAPQAAAAPVRAEREETESEPQPKPAQGRTPVEPFVWAGIICALLLVFLFTSVPKKIMHQPEQAPASFATLSAPDAPAQPARPEKLYLEVVAAEDTWLLVRTDTSPQKKAVLKKGESLIWSADERFIVSYGKVGAVKLLLNGEELGVQGGKDVPVRDLAITRTGIVNQPVPAKQPAPGQPGPKPRPKPAVQAEQTPQPPLEPAKPQTVEHKARESAPVSSPSVINPSLAPGQ